MVVDLLDSQIHGGAVRYCTTVNFILLRCNKLMVYQGAFFCLGYWFGDLVFRRYLESSLNSLLKAR